jgi:hypothetical protein
MKETELYQQSLGDEGFTATIEYDDLYTFETSDTTVIEQKQAHYMELLFKFTPIKDQTLLDSSYEEFVSELIYFLHTADNTYTIQNLLEQLNYTLGKILYDSTENNFSITPKQYDELSEKLLALIKEYEISMIYVCLLQISVSTLDYIVRSSSKYRTNTDSFRPNKSTDRPDPVSQEDQSIDEPEVDPWNTLSDTELIQFFHNIQPVILTQYDEYYTFMVFVSEAITGTSTYTSPTDVLDEFDKYLYNTAYSNINPRLLRIITNHKTVYAQIYQYYFQVYAHYSTDEYTVDWLDDTDSDNDSEFMY